MGWMGPTRQLGDQPWNSVGATELRFRATRLLPPYIALSACIHSGERRREGEREREVAMLRRAAAWSCTESLGSESGDVGGCDEDDVVVDHHQQQLPQAAAAEGPQTSSPEKRRRTDQRRLPPAMPRAAEGGPFMRAERRGGRLILTEVARGPDRRREVFRASRAGGRLQLRFAGVEEEEGEGEEAPDDADADAEPAAPAETAESVATTSGGGGVVVSGYCCNGGGGGGGFCQVAGGAGRRLEIGAVMGT